MRVLLTGNEGYIGTLLVPLLWARNHEVVGLDSGLFRECTLKAIRPVEKTIRKDIRDVEARDLDGIDAVIHLAGLSNDPLGSLAPRFTYEINHEATVRLAEIAKRAGIRRFLYASTCSVYGAAGDEMLDEDSAANPVTPYAESRRAPNRPSAARGSTFCPVYLRAATAYGVSPLLRFDLAVNNLVAWAATTGQVYLKASAPRGARWCTSRTSRSPTSRCCTRPGQGAQPGVQHRAHRGELPYSRRRRDRAPDGAENHRRVRAGRLADCATTGSAASACARAARIPAALDGRSRGRGGLPRDLEWGCTATTSRARATTGSPI